MARPSGQSVDQSASEALIAAGLTMVARDGRREGGREVASSVESALPPVKFGGRHELVAEEGTEEGPYHSLMVVVVVLRVC